jgi:hypothetical protein
VQHLDRTAFVKKPFIRLITVIFLLLYCQTSKIDSGADLVVEEVVDDSVEPLLRVAHIWQLESKHETKPK